MREEAVWALSSSREGDGMNDETNRRPPDGLESPSSEKKGWWAPCGPGEVLAVGIPLVISTLSYSIMQFCDRLFLAWHDEWEMAAVMSAVVLNWTVTAFPMGIAAYAATFVAQYCGSHEEKKVGAVIWMAIRVGVFFFPFFLILASFTENLFAAFGHSESLIPLETIYFQVACFVSAAVVFENALCAFYIGRGKTAVVMYVNLFATSINIVLDVWFIFGWGWIPEMGIEGAAWATTISVWLKVAIFSAILFRPVNIERFGLLTGKKFDWNLFRRLFRYGGPSGWQLCMEGVAISLFILFIGRLGHVEAAATTLAFSVNLLAFIPIVGMSMSVSTLVGQQIGARRTDLAKRAVWNGLWISLVYSSIFAMFYLFWPTLFLLAHRLETHSNSVLIESQAVFLLRFIAVYCVFDAFQVTYAAALKGAGDTMFILWCTILNSIGFVTVGIVGLSFVPVENRLAWWWAIITGWILMFAVVFAIRYRTGKWTTMSVIELNSSERQ